MDESDDRTTKCMDKFKIRDNLCLKYLTFCAIMFWIFILKDKSLIKLGLSTYTFLIISHNFNYLKYIET